MTDWEEWEELKGKQYLLKRAASVLRVEPLQLFKVVQRFKHELEQMRQRSLELDLH